MNITVLQVVAAYCQRNNRNLDDVQMSLKLTMECRTAYVGNVQDSDLWQLLESFAQTDANTIKILFAPYTCRYSKLLFPQAHTHTRKGCPETSKITFVVLLLIVQMPAHTLPGLPAKDTPSLTF